MRTASLWSQGRSRRVRLAFAAGGLILGTCLLLNLVHSVLLALSGGGEDYLAFASAGRLVAAGSHCLYCTDALAARQADLIGYRPPTGVTFPKEFLNPPLFAFAMQPIAQLSLDAGLRLWVCLLVVATAVSTGMVVRALPERPLGDARVLFALAVVVSAPAASGVLLAQVDPLLLVPALGSLLLLRGNRPLAAGLALALVLVKPQLAWLVVPVLAACGMWRMLAGFAGGGLVWVATAPLLLGSDHLGDLVSLLTSSDQQRQSSEARSLPGLLGLIQVGGGAVAVLAMGLGVVVTVAVWRTRATWRMHPELALGLGILASLDTAPHLFSHDYVLLAVPLLAWATRRPWLSLVAAAGLNAAYLLDVSVPVRFAHTQALVVALLGVAIFADITGHPAAMARWLRPNAARAPRPGLPSLRGADAAAP